MNTDRSCTASASTPAPPENAEEEKRAQREAVRQFCDVSAGLRRRPLTLVQRVRGHVPSGWKDEARNKKSGAQTALLMGRRVRVGELKVTHGSMLLKGRPISAPLHRTMMEVHDRRLRGHEHRRTGTGARSDDSSEDGDADERAAARADAVRRKLAVEEFRAQQEAEVRRKAEEKARAAAEIAEREAAAAAAKKAAAAEAAAQAAAEEAEAKARAAAEEAQRKAARERLVPSKAERTRIFRAMDANSSGTLSVSEITQAVKQIWPDEKVLHQPAVIKRAVLAADKNRSGLISRGEFRRLCECLLECGDAWKEFEAMDKDGDGRLTRKEFVAGSQELRLCQGAAEATEVFTSVDENDGGYVLFDEYCAWTRERAWRAGPGSASGSASGSGSGSGSGSDAEGALA